MAEDGITLACTPRDGSTCPRRFAGAIGVAFSTTVLRAASMGWEVRWVAPPGGPVLSGERTDGTGEFLCPDHATGTTPAVTAPPPVRLLCPYGCGGAVWTNDEGAQCCDDDDGGAPGCGASWDAVGYPQDPPTSWPPRVVNRDRAGRG